MSQPRKPSLRKYEALLRRFQYQAALDAALGTGNPVVVVTVLEELMQRLGLTIALAGRCVKGALRSASQHLSH